MEDNLSFYRLRSPILDGGDLSFYRLRSPIPDGGEFEFL
jgi:hypothetical protein